MRVVLTTLLVPALLAPAAALPAQAPRPDAARRAALLAALDRDVWLPFVAGVRGDSAVLYVGVHAPDFHWVAPGSTGRIMDLAEYDADSREVMRRRREEGATSDIEVRFLERNVTETFAAEKVVTRFVLRRPGRAPETSYGIAHHFSRREGGVWRIVLRYGSAERGTEATFAAAAPIGGDPHVPAAPPARPAPGNDGR